MASASRDAYDTDVAFQRARMAWGAAFVSSREIPADSLAEQNKKLAPLEQRYRDLRGASDDVVLYHHCAVCFRTGGCGLKLSLCLGCSTATFYCSRGCQVADWPQHKLVCGCNGSLHGMPARFVWTPAILATNTAYDIGPIGHKPNQPGHGLFVGQSVSHKNKVYYA